MPELAGLKGRAVHEPWRLEERERAGFDYPGPIVTLAEGQRRFAAGRDLT